jgi:hypothetical protein
VSLVTPCDPQWARGQFSVLSCFSLFPLWLALKKKKKNLFQVSCLKHKKKRIEKDFHFFVWLSSWVSYFAC